VEALLPIIINLVSGAVGGNVVGSLLKNLSLGTVGNSIAGILGGGMEGIVGSLLGGGGGGGVLMVAIGFIKKMMAK